MGSPEGSDGAFHAEINAPSDRPLQLNIYAYGSASVQVEPMVCLSSDITIRTHSALSLTDHFHADGSCTVGHVLAAGAVETVKSNTHISVPSTIVDRLTVNVIARNSDVVLRGISGSKLAIGDMIVFGSSVTGDGVRLVDGDVQVMHDSSTVELLDAELKEDLTVKMVQAYGGSRLRLRFSNRSPAKLLVIVDEDDCAPDRISVTGTDCAVRDASGNVHSISS